MKRIQNIFSDLFFLIIAKTPKSILYIISDFIYIIVFYLVKYRRKIVYKNLKNSFPEKTEREMHIIMKKFYHHLCDITLEDAALVRMSKKKVLAFVNFKNPEILKTYYNDNRNAVYRYGIPLGITNGSLKLAIRMVPEEDDPSGKSGETFEAFVIPKKCDTFTQMPKLDDDIIEVK